MEKEAVNKNDFDITTLFKVFRKFWIILLALTVAAGALGGLYTQLNQRDTYTGQVSFWVKGSTSAAAVMASNYTELVDKAELLRYAMYNRNNENPEARPLNEEWNLTEEQTVSVLRGMVTSSKQTDDSCLFSVTVKAGTKKMAYQAIDAIQYAMPRFIAEQQLDLEGVNEVTLIGKVYSEEDIGFIGRSFLKNILLASAAGFLFSYLVLLAILVYSPAFSKSKAKKAEICLSDSERVKDNNEPLD